MTDFYDFIEFKNFLHFPEKFPIIGLAIPFLLFPFPFSENTIMYFTNLIDALISFLQGQGYVWIGNKEDFYSLMYDYNTDKVPAIKYFRQNMVKETNFYMSVPPNISATIALDFADQKIVGQHPLGLKESKDLLDLLGHNSTY